MVTNHDSEYAMAGLRSSQLRRLRRLPVIVTILCIEVLALSLLYFGYGAALSVGVAFGVGVVYVAFPSLWMFATATATRTRYAIRAVAKRARDKSTYQFRLRTLLLGFLLVSIACAWYGHRIRPIQAERRLLEGRWRVLDMKGEPWRDSAGKPVIVNLAKSDYSVDPLQNPKWLDFQVKGGTSHAIYRWEGARLRVMQVSPGLQRPSSFDQAPQDIVPEPGAMIRSGQSSTYFLERVPEEESNAPSADD